MPQQRADFESLASLHRYFITCNLMRKHADDYMASHHANELVPGARAFPDFFAYLSLWYGTLHVTLDGWCKLGLRNSELDPFLTDPKRDILRRFRNATFHFKSDYIHTYMSELIADESSAEWVRAAHDALAEALLIELNGRMRSS